MFQPAPTAHLSSCRSSALSRATAKSFCDRGMPPTRSSWVVYPYSGSPEGPAIAFVDFLTAASMPDWHMRLLVYPEGGPWEAVADMCVSRWDGHGLWVAPDDSVWHAWMTGDVLAWAPVNVALD